MTVAQNVSFGLRIKKLPKEEIERRVTNAVNIVHLQGFENKYPGQLSGGQQQRVAIARSIVLEPILLMLDEPLSNLDAKLRMEMRYELKSLHERLRIASVYVTHDQGEALALSDKIVVLKRGLVMQIGSPKDVFEHPMNLFVADFMGFKNFWKGKIVSMKEENGAIEVCLDINGKELVSRRTYTENETAKVEKLRSSYQNGLSVETAIRPDDFVAGENNVNALSAKMELISYSGNSNDISASVENGLRLDARVESRISERTLSLHAPPEKVHVLVREATDGND
jgi:putative spermidine/putrescine transport system ATP-binding protein